MTKNNNNTISQNDFLYPLKFEPILKSIIWGGSAITEFKNIKPSLDGIGESWDIKSLLLWRLPLVHPPKELV
jgi:mannose-6-phosphate isomerase